MPLAVPVDTVGFQVLPKFRVFYGPPAGTARAAGPRTGTASNLANQWHHLKTRKESSTGPSGDCENCLV